MNHRPKAYEAPDVTTSPLRNGFLYTIIFNQIMSNSETICCCVWYKQGDLNPRSRLERAVTLTPSRCSLGAGRFIRLSPAPDMWYYVFLWWKARDSNPPTPKSNTTVFDEDGIYNPAPLTFHAMFVLNIFYVHFIYMFTIHEQ